MHWLEHVRFIMETDPVTQALLAACCVAALVYAGLLVYFKIGSAR